MKKQLLFLAIILTFLANNVYSQTVYVTKTGQKYHQESCKYLSKSSIPISLNDAVIKGYGPCSVCKPLSAAPTNFSNIQIENQQSTQQTQNADNSSNKNTLSVQCSATTQAGTRCTRMIKSQNGRCWQHGGN